MGSNGLAIALCAFLALLAPLRGRAAEVDVASPQGLPQPLHLEDALALFRARGFDLLLADAAVASAEADLSSVRALRNPVLSGTGGSSFHYDPSLCAQCSRTPWGGSLSDLGLLFDFLIGKRRLGISVARSALAAARLSRSDAERTLTVEVEQQYVATVLAGTLLRFARETSASSAHTADLVALRFRAGDVAQADVARAQTSQLEAEQGIEVASQELAEAKAQLAYLLGERDARAEFEVDADLPATPPPPELEGASVDGLVALARSRRPDLAAARVQVEGAAAALALARRQRLPDIVLTGSYSQEGSGQNAIQPPTATLGVSLALPIFDHNAGAIAKAAAGARAQEVARDKLDAQIVSEVTRAFAAYASAHARVARMEGALLESARQARDLVDYQYQKGASTLLDLLEAQRSYAAIHAEYFQSLGDYWDARFQIEAATGLEIHR